MKGVYEDGVSIAEGTLAVGVFTLIVYVFHCLGGLITRIAGIV